MCEIIIFDIETGPLPLDVIKRTMPPFEQLAKHPGEFDPTKVKVGNLKDEAKIQAKIEEARAKHAEAIRDYELELTNGESNYWASVLERAALSATAGQVLAVGYRGNKVVIDCQDGNHWEVDLLARFWTQFRSCQSANRKLVGFYSSQFDLPFLVQRSWILGIDVPRSIFTATGYFDPVFVDLHRIWNCNVRNGNTSTLDVVCRACGLGSKPKDCDGASFSKLFWGEGTRETAIAYLENDLNLTYRLAEKLGVC